MGRAGYHAAAAASVRARTGAAMAALVLHGLALLAAVWLDGPAQTALGERSPHLTVLALAPPRPPSGRTAQARPSLPSTAHGVPATRAGSDPLYRALPSPFPGGGSVGPGAPPLAVAAAPAPAPAVEHRQPPPPAVARADDTGAIAAYAQRLWQHIADRRPRAAALRGTTIIQFRLTPAGGLISAEVARSSGNFNLDRIALRTVRQAAPMPPPPGGLAGDQLSFTVPVEFR